MNLKNTIRIENIKKMSLATESSINARIMLLFSFVGGGFILFLCQTIEIAS